jgi:hypothetical protein
MANTETVIARRVDFTRLFKVIRLCAKRTASMGNMEIAIIAYSDSEWKTPAFSCKCHSEMAPLGQSRLRPARRSRSLRLGPRLIFRNGSVRAPAGQN